MIVLINANENSVREKLSAAVGGRLSGIFEAAVLQLFFFMGGALSASVNGFGVISPFGTAFAVCCDGRFLISSCIGAAAGYVLSHDSVSALRYICSLLCAAVVVSLLRRSDRLRKTVLTECLCVFASMLATGVTVMLAQQIRLESLAVYFGEALTGFAAAYVFTCSRRAVKPFLARGGFSRHQLQCVIMFTLIMLLSLSEITLFSFSPARALAVFLMLTAVELNCDFGVTAVAFGLIFAFDRQVEATAFIYSAAGLAAGIVPKAGKVFRGAAFLISYCSVYAFFTASADRLFQVAEVTAACIVFMCLPDGVFLRIRQRLLIADEQENTASARRAVIARLDEAATAVSQISDCVGAAAALLKPAESDAKSEVILRVRDEVCAQCSHFGLCWSRNFSDCRRAFESMDEDMRNNKILSPDSLPRFLAGCCPNKQVLVQSFMHRYLERCADESSSRQIEQLREITRQQLGGLNMMLGEMSDELSSPVITDRELADGIYRLLREEFSLKVRTVVCFRDVRGRLKIEIRVSCKPEKLSAYNFIKALEETCAVALSNPQTEETRDGIVIRLCERARYRVEAAASRSSADGGGLCGDSYEGFYDGEGNYYAVLSDGMGTGYRAAVDSSLTVTMAVKLIKAGFSVASALRLVNCAMLLRSSGETLCTADVLKVDLYTGTASFYKAGACCSLVKRRSRLIEIDSASMPLGILSETEIAEQSVSLGDGDLVLIGSDGAYEYCGNSAKNAFCVSAGESVGEITQRVLLETKKAREGGRADDVTVIAVRLCDGRKG